MKIPSGRTILRRLRKLDEYLGQFPYKQSIYFEQLISLAFSRGFYLPFYTNNNDDETIEYKVVWNGSDIGGNLLGSPQGKPDIVAYCFGFYLILEATQKTSSNQWTQEFAQAVRHCGDFVRENSVEPNEVYIVLITPKLHEDTYQSLRHHPQRDYKIVPLETKAIVRILETAILAFTIKHLEFRKLFNEIPKCLAKSSSLLDFRNGLEDELRNWQREVLRQERRTFLSVKAYEAMQKTPRVAVAVSEILDSLLKHPFVGQYLKIAGEELNSNDIETVLVEESLGSRAGRTIQTDEQLFECVPCSDYKGRGLRLIGEVESIG